VTFDTLCKFDCVTPLYVTESKGPPTAWKTCFGGRGMRATRRQAAAVGLGSVLTLCACGSSPTGSASAPPTRTAPTTVVTPRSSNAAPSTSPSGSVAKTPTRFSEAYANAFEDFWVAYARADRDADAQSPQLSRIATGAALVWAREQIEAHIKLGVAHRGGAAFRSVGADHVTSTSALIGQCMDWSTWPVVNRRTGTVFQQFAAYSQLVDSRMVVTAGQWRVSTVRVRDVRC
jgi:hypothetical protein